MKKDDGKTKVLSMLSELANYYQLISDPRYYAYIKAINSISTCESKDFTKEFLSGSLKIQYVGPSISDKILDTLNGFVPDKVYEIRSKMKEILNAQTKNPHKHYTHRSEVESIIKDICDKYVCKFNDKATEFYILGSYRRGAEYVGDADLLVVSDNDISLDLIESIESTRIDDFKKDSQLYSFSAKGPSKLKLVNTLTNFEIDVRFCRPSQLGSFMLHMTGSGSFNVRLRHLAKTKGYSLSEYGVLDLATNKLIEFRNEEEIFDFLGIEYVAPENRS